MNVEDTYSFNGHNYKATFGGALHKIPPANFKALFDDRFIWGRHEIINGEDQFYLPHELSNYTLTRYPEYLAMVARRTPELIKNIAIGLPKKFADDLSLLGEAYDPSTGEFTDIALSHYAGTRKRYISSLLTTRTGIDPDTGARSLDYGFKQKGGYFTITCRLPKAAGAWSAFWLLPTFKSWPSGVPKLPEIDVFEALRNQQNGNPHTAAKGFYDIAVHTYDTANGEMQDRFEGQNGLVTTGIDLTETFNTYGVSIENDFIMFTFNHNPIASIPTPADMVDLEWHMLFNLAIGGDPNWREQAAESDYPASLDVKSIIAYQRIETPVEPEEPELELALPNGDVMVVLPSGRPVSRSDLNLTTELLIALGEGKLEFKPKEFLK